MRKSSLMVAHEHLIHTVGQVKEALQPEVAYVRPPQRSQPCGIGCHVCGSDAVSEYEEVDPHDWDSVTNVLYVCHDCQASWSYKVTGR